MVTAKYLENKFVKPLIDRHKSEGREEGIAMGKAAERRRWTEWNASRYPIQREA